MRARKWLHGALALWFAASAGACGDDGEGPAAGAAGRHPWIVIGIDGGEWRVIRQLWEEGRLPNLRAIAERGSTATLRTAYARSPVIWTTIATGVVPDRHGITDFVAPTAAGDVPATSTLRRVPALWNMLSRARRRVAVLGWWATWPAEEVNGVVFSDRALLDLDRRVHAPGLESEVDAALAEAAAAPNAFGGNDLARRMDQAVARLARRLAARREFDLMLVYFRGVDIVSHSDWQSFVPRAFGLAGESGGEVPRAYEAVDAAVGEILAAAPPYSNVMVVSDHGFRALRPAREQAVFDLDAALQRLGYLERGRDGGVDLARTRVFTYSSPHARMAKLVRYARAGREPGATRGPADFAAVRSALERDLERLRWASGAPALAARPARPREIRHGADFVVEVLARGMTPTLLLDGAPVPGILLEVNRLSGSHGTHTHGIFLAAGPDVAPGVDLARLHIHDLAPTLLYGLGLPVAADFAGSAALELFTAEWRRRRPLRRIATWGRPGPGVATASPADQQLLEELGALGYLN